MSGPIIWKIFDGHTLSFRIQKKNVFHWRRGFLDNKRKLHEFLARKNEAWDQHNTTEAWSRNFLKTCSPACKVLSIKICSPSCKVLSIKIWILSSYCQYYMIGGQPKSPSLEIKKYSYSRVLQFKAGWHQTQIPSTTPPNKKPEKPCIPKEYYPPIAWIDLLTIQISNWLSSTLHMIEF